MINHFSDFSQWMCEIIDDTRRQIRKLEVDVLELTEPDL
jgi:hypothetical protein